MFGLWLGWWTGCDALMPSDGEGAACGPEECAPVCAGLPPVEPVPVDPNAPAPPTDAEQALLDAILVEVRQGIRPFSPEAIGICRGRKGCDKFLGPEAGRLGKGNYFVKAELLVPPGPAGSWKVHFQTECTLATGEIKMFEREYDVVSEGSAAHRLWPLREIESPSDEGAQKCTYKLTTRDPAGDKVYAGSWEVVGK